MKETKTEQPNEIRKLTKISNDKYILHLENLKARSVTDKEYSKSELVDAYQEIQDFVRHLNEQETTQKKEIAKIPEIKFDKDELRELKERINEIQSIDLLDKCNEKLKEIQKEKLRIMKQGEEIYHVCPEVARAKKK